MKAWENAHLAKMLYNVGTRVKDGPGCQTPSLPHLSCKMLLGAGSKRKVVSYQHHRLVYGLHECFVNGEISISLPVFLICYRTVLIAFKERRV